MTGDSANRNKVAILTCMDARIVTTGILGYGIGEAYIVRNAGGRASDDALRSLVVSQRFLNTKEVFVIHHTECGMASFDNHKMCEKLEGDLGKDAAEAGKKMEWLTFKDLEQSVKDDVAFLKASPMIPDTIPVKGFIYDIHTHKVNPVE